ncbi:hypothetical protein Fmac_013922 [Flemingia macrophylla]|uniref:Uncharacterized protein n=1 Tax=Flemingia macrophylla TaxID=520843 RepID=A0ABD1MA82_9FABA
MATQNANVVFVDTNLDTHFALVVSDFDTVSDLKKSIVSEHPLCFPKIGQIRIHGIKVKRRGHFYHLSDSMPVRSAFTGGSNKSWFLSVDASALGECVQNEHLVSNGSPHGIANNVLIASGDDVCGFPSNNVLIASGDDACGFPSKRVSVSDNSRLESKHIDNGEVHVASPCVSEHTGRVASGNLDMGVKLSSDIGAAITFPRPVFETAEHCVLNDLVGLNVECDVNGSISGDKNDRTVSEENPLISLPSVKRKRKSKKKNEDAVHDGGSKDNAAFVDDPRSFPSKSVSPFDDFQLPQLENKLIENGELPVASPCASERTGKGAVEDLDTGVKLSGDNDSAVAFHCSVSKTEDHRNLHELPGLNIEYDVDGSAKGIEDDRKVCEENSMSVPSVKKKRKSKRKIEDKVQDDNSKENAAFVVNPLSFTSKKASSVNNELPVSGIECEVDGTNKGIKDEEGNCKSASNEKKRQKSKKKQVSTVREDDLKENGASVVGSINYTMQQGIEIVTNHSENADKEVINETEVLKEPQHTDCTNNNNKNDIDAAASIKEASEPGLATNKKHKKRKRSLIVEAHEERKETDDQFELKNEKSNAEYKDNKATEDILNTEPPAKKKKGKDKSGEESLSKEKLIDDFNADNASQHVAEDQHNIKNSNADQSTEHFNDADPLITSVRRKKRKGKVNSSNPPETPVVTSSRKDEQADRFSIQRGVLEEISEVGLFSKDISMSRTTIDNVETGTDACKEGIHSTEKITGNYKNHSDCEIKSQTSVVDEPTVLTKDKENVVLDQCHENEAGQIEVAEEGREVSPQNDSELMLLDNSTLFNQDNTDANVSELNGTSKVMDVNEMTEPVKPEKDKKRIRKNKNSTGQPTPREGIGLMDASESETVIMRSHSATNCDPKTANRKEENPLNQTVGGKILQEEIKGTSEPERMNKRQIKKSNNKQTSTSKSISNKLTADQVDDSKKPSESSGNGTHSKPSVAGTKESKSASTKSTNKSSKTNLESAKDSVRLEPSDSQFSCGSKDSDSQFNSGSKDTVQHLTLSPGEKDGDNLEPPSKTLKINADQQLSSGKEQDEAYLVDNMDVDKRNGSDRTDIETMAGKNMHALKATNRLTHVEDLSSSQKLSSKEEVAAGIQSGKKVSNVHRKDHVNAFGKSMDLEKQREFFLVSNSKLEGSIKRGQNKAGKASGNNVHGVVSKTHQKKSLLAGAIFNYDSSSTSEDEVDNSDASTRTPSDNPLLSDSSDGYSSSDLDSQVAGSHGGKSLENGGRSSVKASFSGTGGMSIDQLLRSSRRFKKAKTTASQLEETQSQLEFVPDSLAD